MIFEHLQFLRTIWNGQEFFLLLENLLFPSSFLYIFWLIQLQNILPENMLVWTIPWLRQLIFVPQSFQKRLFGILYLHNFMNPFQFYIRTILAQKIHTLVAQRSHLKCYFLSYCTNQTTIQLNDNELQNHWKELLLIYFYPSLFETYFLILI